LKRSRITCTGKMKRITGSGIKLVEEMPLKVVLYPDTSRLEHAVSGLGARAPASGGGGIGFKQAAVAGVAGGATAVMITKGLGLIAKKLEESSGILKGSLHVLNKAFTMFFRPFADFLGILLRPLAIALLKISVLWHKWLASIFGKSEMEKAAEAGDEEKVAKLRRDAIKDFEAGNKNVFDLQRLAAEERAGRERAALPDWLDWIASIGEFMEKAKIALGEHLFNFFNGIFAWGQEVGAQLAEDFNAWWEETGLKDFFTGVSEGFNQLLAGDFQGVATGFSNWLNDANTAIKNTIGIDVAQLLGDFSITVDNFVASIKTWVNENVVAPIAKFLEPISTVINDFVSSVVAWINDNIITPISNFFAPIVEALQNFVDGFIDGIKSWIGNLFGGGGGGSGGGGGGGGAGAAPYLAAGASMTSGGVTYHGSPTGTPVPAAQEGGYVARGGAAIIHKGETIVPASGGNMTFNFYNARITGKEEARELIEEAFAQVGRRFRV